MSACTMGWLTDRLMLCICRSTANSRKQFVWCACSSTGLSQDGYPDFEQTEPILNGSSGIWCCRRDYTHHRTSVFVKLSCSRLDRIARRYHYMQTRASEAVQCRTDNRSQKSACHRRRDVAATRVSQLDQSGLLYTAGRGLVPRLTLAELWTVSPLEAIMLTHSEQTVIDGWDTKQTICAPCRWRHTTPRDDAGASCGQLCRMRQFIYFVYFIYIFIYLFIY